MLKGSPEMQDFLRTHGVTFDTWPVPSSLGGLEGKPTLTEEEAAASAPGLRP